MRKIGLTISLNTFCGYVLLIFSSNISYDRRTASLIWENDAVKVLKSNGSFDDFNAFMVLFVTIFFFGSSILSFSSIEYFA